MYTKKLFQLAGIIFIFFVLAKSANAAITIRPALNLGMVGYWAMDEGAGNKAYDQSGNGNTGTLTQMDPATDWVDGKLGKGLDFDGDDDLVNANSPDLLDNLPSLTFSVWAKADDYGEAGQGFFVSKSNYDDSGWHLQKAVTNSMVQFIVAYDGSTNLSISSANNTFPASDFGNWIHWVVTWDGTANYSGVHIYKNGAEVAYGTRTNGDGNRETDAGRNLIIGNQGGNTRTFDGSLDETRIYNRALSAGEVKRLYNLTKPKLLSPNNNGLVGYWSFEEGAGTKAGDMSGRGKNGNVTGANWTEGKRGKALSLDGANDYVDAGNVGDGVKTVSFWVKPSTLTNRIIDLNGTAKVELVSGIITTSGITSPTIYIDGVATSTIDANWHYVTIKTDTGINASAAKLGQGFSCGDNISFTYKGGSVTYGTVDVSGQCWMDRNLGASQAATAYNDSASYGDYFQWGRLDDGHQTSNSVTTSTLSSTDVPGHGNFILSTAGPFDWRSPQNDNLWQAASSYTNNPCPSGWHIPLQAEWSTAMTNLGLASCSSNCPVAIANSSLKVPSAGYRLRSSGALQNPDGYGSYWSSSPFNLDAYSLDIGPTSVSTGFPDRAYGYSARCLMHAQPTSYFSGKLDEVRFYNRALTPAEVAGLYQASGRKATINSSQNTQLTTGLVGLWSFNGPDIADTIAYDRSGQGKNGTITGARTAIGKVGQALTFDGTDDSINLGNVYNGVKSVTFWVKTGDLSDNGYFDGKLDEVRFYNSTLSTAEVKRLYKLGAGGTTLPLTNVDPSAKLVALNSSSSINVLNGTIGTKGITNPTIYVDGAAGTAIDDNWRFVAITTATGINASTSTLALGPAWECGDTLTYCGDSYTTVQMSATYGSQCWLGENLRNTTKPDCTTAITTYCNPSGCDSPWGRLYDWDTTMNGAATSTGCGAKIQGICPSGWHIPSDYTSCSNDDFPALGTDGGALKKTGTTEWTSPNTGATNASGWTGYPSGYWNSGFGSRGDYGFFWSSSESGGAGAWYRSLGYNSTGWTRQSGSKTQGRSVRCLKD